jgi:glycosyltransferase involved in cell wall biosynthesis
VSGSTGGHVALVLPNLAGGGAERVMVLVGNYLARHAVRVDLVAGSFSGPYVDAVDPGVRRVDLGHTKMSAATPGLVRYLRAESPVAVLSTLDWMNVLAVFASRFARPSRLVLREAVHPEAERLNNPTAGRWLLERAMAVSYPRASLVVAVSEGVASFLRDEMRLEPDKVRVIYGPHYDERILESASEPAGHPWFSDGDLPIVVAAGRLNRQKDFPTLIAAFHRVRSSRPARLVILGEGPDRPQLEALVKRLGLKDDVSLPGFVVNPFSFFSHASLFVLSSIWEGLPGVLSQAMACGCPVVATDCPSGPSEVLEGGRWGALVPVGDPDRMAEAMAATLDSPPDSDVLKNRARLFSADVACERYAHALGVECRKDELEGAA